jgi:hypothetical protein
MRNIFVFYYWVYVEDVMCCIFTIEGECIISAE